MGLDVLRMAWRDTGRGSNWLVGVGDGVLVDVTDYADAEDFRRASATLARLAEWGCEAS